MDDSRWISEFITLAATYNTLSNYKGTVANDAYIELIKALNTYKTAVRAEAKAEALREAADRAIAWQIRLCKQDDWGCADCGECADLRAAILADQATEAAARAAADAAARAADASLPDAKTVQCTMIREAIPWETIAPLVAAI